MTATELQTRVEKSQFLPVISVGNGVFFVESSDGKISYRVEITDNAFTCTCADYQKNARNDKDFKCKHILAMLGTEADDIKVKDYLEKNSPKLDNRWIMNLKGKDFVLYAGLLDLAHQKGLLKLEVEAVQYPSKENGNVAICRAVAVSRLGDVYSDIGDADPGNTNSMISKHLLRMASTRAKARVLRDFSNIGMTALEELGDFDDVIGKETGKATSNKKATDKKATVTNIKDRKAGTAKPKAAKKPAKEVVPADRSESQGNAEKKVASAEKVKEKVVDIKSAMSPAQSKAIKNLAGRRGITEDELSAMVQDNFKSDFESLTPADASTLIRQLQQSA